MNLLADMGVQPNSIQTNLQSGERLDDTTPPVSVITSPASGANLNTGTAVTVTGTATDSGGGVVGAVEVSADGGATWHPASGRASWSYSFTPTVTGQITIKSRAADDSGNIETPKSGVTVSVAPQVCPCGVWNTSNVPVTQDSGDGNAVEVGLKFRADADGTVLGVRFYKSAANKGTHVGHLWTSSGTQLATATFTSESSLGLAAGQFRAAGCDHRKHNLRCVLLRSSGSLFGRRQRLCKRRRGRSSAACACQWCRRRERCLRLHKFGPGNLPELQFPRDELLGRRGATRPRIPMR